MGSDASDDEIYETGMGDDSMGFLDMETDPLCHEETESWPEVHSTEDENDGGGGDGVSDEDGEPGALTANPPKKRPPLKETKRGMVAQIIKNLKSGIAPTNEQITELRGNRRQSHVLDAFVSNTIGEFREKDGDVEEYQKKIVGAHATRHIDHATTVCAKTTIAKLGAEIVDNRSVYSGTSGNKTIEGHPTFNPRSMVVNKMKQIEHDGRRETQASTQSDKKRAQLSAAGSAAPPPSQTPRLWNIDPTDTPGAKALKHTLLKTLENEPCSSVHDTTMLSHPDNLIGNSEFGAFALPMSSKYTNDNGVSVSSLVDAVLEIPDGKGVCPLFNLDSDGRADATRLFKEMPPRTEADPLSCMTRPLGELKDMLSIRRDVVDEIGKKKREQIVDARGIESAFSSIDDLAKREYEDKLCARADDKKPEKRTKSTDSADDGSAAPVVARNKQELSKQNNSDRELSTLITQFSSLVKTVIPENVTHSLTAEMVRAGLATVIESDTFRTISQKSSEQKIIAALVTTVFRHIGVPQENYARSIQEKKAAEYIKARMSASSGAKESQEVALRAVMNLVDSINKDVQQKCVNGMCDAAPGGASSDSNVEPVPTHVYRVLFDPFSDTMREAAKFISHTSASVGSGRMPAFVRISLVNVGSRLEIPNAVITSDADSVTFAVTQHEIDEMNSDHFAVFSQNEHIASYVAKYFSACPTISIAWLSALMVEPDANDPYVVRCMNGNLCIGKKNTMRTRLPKFILRAFEYPNEDWAAGLLQLVHTERELRRTGMPGRLSDEQLAQRAAMYENSMRKDGAATDPQQLQKIKKCVLEYTPRRCVQCTMHSVTTQFVQRREARAVIHPFVVSAGPGGFKYDVLLIPKLKEEFFCGIIGPFPAYNESRFDLVTIVDEHTSVHRTAYIFNQSNFQ